MLHRRNQNRPNFTPYGFTCELWQAERNSRPDQHDEIEINYLTRGSLTYLLGGELVTILPRTFTIFWAAVPHQVQSYRDVHSYYVATVPFDLFLQWDPPAALLSRLVLGEMLADSGSQLIVDDEALFQQWIRDLDGPTSRSDRAVQFEMAARILRMVPQTAPADNLPPDRRLAEGGQAATGLGKAEAMACYVAQNYQSGIRIKDIADVVDLHPDYASTLFRQTFGMTLTSLITKHRVADVQRQLLTTDDTVLDIAHKAGFESLSRFNSAFKSVTGVTPREYRKRMRLFPSLK